MAQEPIQISASVVLVVEGDDEKRLINALASHLGLFHHQVICFDGKSNLRPFLKGLVKAPGFREKVAMLGIVRDADFNATNAFASVCGALRHVGLPVPMAPSVLAGTSLYVSVMILPDGSSKGELEDVCLQAVSSDPAMECVDVYFNCLKRCNHSLPKKLAKAKVQTFLASRAKVFRHLGDAADAGCWPWEAEAFEGLKKFLKSLNSLPA